MFARDYRELALENLRGNWKPSILTAMVACLLGGLIVGSSFFPEFEIKIEGQNFRNIPEILSYAFTNYGLTISFVSALGLLQFILAGVIQLGYAQYLLNQYDHRDPQFSDLFSKFDRFGAGFCQFFLCTLYVTLWSLLLIIPGIIAGLSYSMTPFIMAEHPELTASEAIRASKKMMCDNKWALFCLNMSFIGWILLCGLSFNIGNLWLNPYLNAAQAAFYRKVSVSDPYNEM